jgi:hypothetical protein
VGGVKREAGASDAARRRKHHRQTLSTSVPIISPTAFLFLENA